MLPSSHMTTCWRVDTHPSYKYPNSNIGLQLNTLVPLLAVPEALRLAVPPRQHAQHLPDHHFCHPMRPSHTPANPAFELQTMVHAPHAPCMHCPGWQHHPVSNRKYHFIIPCDEALADMAQVPGVVQARDEGQDVCTPPRCVDIAFVVQQYLQRQCSDLYLQTARGPLRRAKPCVWGLHSVLED